MNNTHIYKLNLLLSYKLNLLLSYKLNLSLEADIHCRALANEVSLAIYRFSYGGFAIEV